MHVFTAQDNNEMDRIERSMKAEYFRPKFQEVMKKYKHWTLGIKKSEELLNELIECLKNEEGL